MVRRRRAVETLLAARHAALALVVAPPGYGKSTLLSEWEQQDDRAFVWLGIGEREIDFARGVTSADWHALPQLVRALRARQRSFVVVLDNAQLIERGLLRRLVEAAVRELPHGSTIALASRAEPWLALGRLRTHRALVEVRMHQLAMTPVEAAALLAREGVELGREDVRALVRRTEGWAAALYLATLAQREDSDGAASFTGHHHLMRDYLRDEILGPLPDDLRTFSIRSSVLAELSGPACDAVLNEHGSALVLAQLAEVNPLLMPIDAAHERYRWHTVVSDALNAELHRFEPELEPGLQRRAALWHAEHGEVERALDHAAAAGDAVLVGDLLRGNLLAYLTRGRADRVRGWLGALGDRRVESYAPLTLAAALSSVTAGEAGDARRWSSTGRAALERGSAATDGRALAAGFALVDAMTDCDSVARMGELATSARDSADMEAGWRPLCLLLRGVGAQLTGDSAAAGELLDEGIAVSGNATPALTALCLAERAVAAIESKEWDLAAELTDRAVMVVGEWDLVRDPLMAIVFAAAAASRAHHGRVDEAKADLRQGVELLTALGDFVAWYGAQARILLAHASLWLADVVAARALLAEASRFARRAPDATCFGHWFDDAWAYIDTLAESRLTGPSSLTIAELRILRFLPSHRSFREIGAQLGVSANTVKTQAHAVYRKLGAASRSEAVMCAMQAGLLGQ